MSDAVTTRLRAAAKNDGLVVALTGAGISAESGIPTFRGREGYWTVGSREYHPQEMATHAAFERMPDEVWRWYLYRRAVCRAAAPNPAHRALVELDAALGDRFRLVTQNVDGLHIRAGNPLARTWQIHGNIDFMRCGKECSSELVPIPDGIAPKQRESTLSDSERDLLRCNRCRAAARPHVLWFDESYNEALYFAESALDAAERAVLLLVVGTSGSTTLPMRIAMTVARRRALVVDVNPEDNPFARIALESGGAFIREPASVALPKLTSAFAP